MENILSEKEKQSDFALLTRNLNVGKALYEMLFDKKGKPVDYRFIEANTAFEKYTGLKRKDILGKTALELFTSVERNRISEYGKVAISGNAIEFQDYSPVTDKYFQIKVSCPKKGLVEINMNDVTDIIKSKKKYGNNYREQKTVSEIKKLLCKAENRSDFLEEVCKYLVQKKDYFGVFILLQYNNGMAKDLYRSGYGSNASNIRNAVIKGVDLPCCKIAKKRNGSIAICDPVSTCKDCVVCQKDTIHAAFSISLKYMGKTYGILVVSVPKEYVYNQQEISCFYELATDISFALHLFDHYNKDYFFEKNKDLIEEQTAQIAALIEENKKLQIKNEYSKATENCKIFFLENISHEIKNQLNGILGFSQLLQKSELLTAELKEYADLINFCGDQLLYTFNNINEISKIEAGLIRFNSDKQILDNLLTDLHKKFIEIVESKKANRINLIYRPNKSIGLIFIDKMLLKALEHILNNAVKFTYLGEIEFGYESYGENTILFYVKDTGIGIPKKKWKVIFEKFRQVEESSQKKYSGQGLGLSIAKGYIEKMLGKIWLESEVGKGTTFYFTLPYVTHNNDQ